jgi:hypothetical protein
VAQEHWTEMLRNCRIGRGEHACFSLMRHGGNQGAVAVLSSAGVAGWLTRQLLQQLLHSQLRWSFGFRWGQWHGICVSALFAPSSSFLTMAACRSAGSGDGAHWRQRCMLANLCRGPECPRACRPIAIHSLVQPPGLEVLFSRGCWGPVLVVQRSSQPAPQETSLCIQYSRPTNMLQGKQATIIVEVAVW